MIVAGRVVQRRLVGRLRRHRNAGDEEVLAFATLAVLLGLQRRLHLLRLLFLARFGRRHQRFLQQEKMR